MINLHKVFIETCLLGSLLVFSFSAYAIQLQTVTLAIKNMTCSMCPFTVRKALSAVPGVEEVTTDFKQKTATVRFEPAKTNIKELIDSTTTAGYPSEIKNAKPTSQ